MLLAAVLEHDIEAAFHIFLHPSRYADAAGLSDAFQARGDVDAIAEDVAIVRDDVADVNADAQLNPPGRRDIEVGAGHGKLDIDGTARRIDRAGKFSQHSVAGSPDDPAAMVHNLRIEQIHPVILELLDRSFLVQPHQPAVPGDIGRQDR